MIFDRFFRLSEIPGVGVRCSDQGLFVGPTPLLESVPARNGRVEWRVRCADAIARDLGKNYGMPIAMSAKMPGIAAIARALNDGNLAYAQIATLLLKFPDPPNVIELKLNASATSSISQSNYSPAIFSIAIGTPQNTRDGPPSAPTALGANLRLAMARRMARTHGPPAISRRRLRSHSLSDIPAPGAIPFPWEILPPPLVAPNILPRTLPQNPYPGRPECVKEWQEAFAFCWRLKINRQLGRGASRGMGRTLRDCMLGQVSESCGGNAATI